MPTRAGLPYGVTYNTGGSHCPSPASLLVDTPYLRVITYLPLHPCVTAVVPCSGAVENVKSRVEGAAGTVIHTAEDAATAVVDAVGGVWDKTKAKAEGVKDAITK